MSPRRHSRSLIVRHALAMLVAAAAFSTPSAAPVGQQTGAPQSSPDGVWEAVPVDRIPRAPANRTLPAAYRVVRLNAPNLESVLSRAPLEFSGAGRIAPVILTLPLPDGRYGRFRIEESPIQEPELAAQTRIRTYIAQGLDDPTASARLDWGPEGFHGFILSGDSSVYIDPWTIGDTEHYISYFKRDARRDAQEAAFQCQLFDTDSEAARQRRQNIPATVTHGASLRTYRIAIAATGEYTTFFRQAGDTDDQAIDRAQASIVTALNRINGIYERELAVRMTLVATNRTFVFANPATDGYTNDNAIALLTENHNKLTTELGTANFDVGHVVATGGGGVAALGSVCSATQKGQGMTGGNNPVGDPFVVDFVAHEIGHQFGGQHTYNASSGGSCTTREATAAFEPASGSSIMAYGGICSPNDLVTNSHDNFHVRSLEEMTTFLDNAAEGGSCGTAANTNNQAPVITPIAGVTIPKETPFALTASATDADGDALTYSWEEYDLGPVAPPHNDNDGTARPILRAYAPTTSGTRTFPSLTYILNNANVPPATTPCGTPPRVTPCVTGEDLPSISRAMKFQVIVRDSRAGGGRIISIEVPVTVDAASGPFRVTSPNTAAFDEGTIRVVGGTPQTITWDVANTAAAPVSAANVRISLSTDGGTTFPTVMVASTPNDGSEQLVIPNIASTTARVKIEAVGNVFFDISDVNFTITAGAGCTFSINPTTQAVVGAGAAHTAAVTAGAGCAWTAISNNTVFITVTGGATGTGNGTVTYTVALNAGVVARSGTLTIAGQTLTVTQAAGGGSTITTTTSTSTSTSSESPPACSPVGSSRVVTTIITTSTIGRACIGVNNRDVANPSPACDGAPAAPAPVDPFRGTVFIVPAGSVNFNTNTHTDTVVCVAANAPPTVAITTPAASPATATSPFITLAGTAADDVAVANVTWVSNRGPSGTATGTTNWSAEVPLFAGANIFTVTATDGPGLTGTATKTVNVTVFTYFLAEGATGTFFDLDILLGNPNAVDAPTTIQFLRDDGVVVPLTGTLGANTRTTIRVDDLAGLADTAVSAVVTSTNALPILVERTMRWNAQGYGSHTEKAIAGTNLNWFFAEGSQGFFDTYLLLVNPNAAANVTTVNFLTEDIGVVTRTFTVPANSRFNIHAGSIPQLINKSFGINVAFTLPGAAERAMYFGTPLFNGGHESAGVTQAANLWFHAEGATGPYFSTFILITNPNTAPATVTMRFLPATGGPVSKVKVIPANTRLTVNVATEDPSLANIAVATEVSSNIPVISERAMYWPGSFNAWFEAHNSFGVNAAATKWGLAEGRVGNPPGTPAGQSPNFETYILLANPGAAEATVTINYLLTTGAPVVKTYTVAPNSRFNVQVNSAVPELVNTTFAAVISSTVPIAVERAMYSNASGVIWAAGTNATAIRIP